MINNTLFSLSADPTDPAEQIYQLYPKKVGRPHALKAIRRAIKIYGFEKLEQRVSAYAQKAKLMNPQFIPHPATWFNQERFADDPATWTASSTGGLSLWELSKVLELKEERARVIKDRWSYDGHWTDLNKFDEYKKLRSEITSLKQRMEESIL